MKSGRCEPKQAAGSLPCEDNEPSRSPGRISLLSIPDLIRDPEGGAMVHSEHPSHPKQSKITAKKIGDGSLRVDMANPCKDLKGEY
jgi:hypothetical protein